MTLNPTHNPRKNSKTEDALFMIRFTPLFLLFSLAGFAQVTFEISPREVAINEVVQFTIRVENGRQGRQPSFTNGMDPGSFELLSRRPNSSTSMSFINGVSNTTQSFSYNLRPTREGKIIFPAQTVVYDGKTYKSQPAQITVTAEQRRVQQSRDRFGRRRQSREAEVFAALNVPKSDYYMGEPIPVEVVIYRTPNLRLSNQGSSMELPDFKDFWVEDGQGDTQESVKRVDGKEYIAFVAARKRLYPNLSGEIEIPPAAFQLSVSVGSGFFADWQRVRRDTEPVKLNIKPLPQNGRPANFSGLVGDFQIRGSLDKDSVKVGDSASFNIEVTGNGNFSAINQIKPEGLDGNFEVFDGGTPTLNELRGNTKQKTWLFALVPKREGQFEIPVPKLSFFDLKTRSYKTAEAPTIPIEVLPGEGLGQGVQPGGENRLVAEQNLSFIKLGELGENEADVALPNPSRLVQVVIGFLILDFLVFLGLTIHYRVASRQVNFRPKYALRNFKKAVGGLNGKAKDADAFYAGLSQAILNYFGDKWERAGKGVSLDAIRDKFNREGIDEALFTRVEECIEACDLARFTPSSPASREQLLDKASAAIEEIEGVLK